MRKASQSILYSSQRFKKYFLKFNYRIQGLDDGLCYKKDKKYLLEKKF